MPSSTRSRSGVPTPSQILDIAERLAQTRGFNGFSYADIATELGITKASLHYHFASKADLGRALIERYSTAFADALSRIEASELDARVQLQRYMQLYHDVLSKDRLCLCGMLAAEVTTLPDPMKDAIRRFFDENEAWLVRVLEAGRRAASVTFEGNSRDTARGLTAALEGAMLLARSYGEAARFTTAATRLLSELTPVSGARRKRAVRSQPPARRRLTTRARRT